MSTMEEMNNITDNCDGGKNIVVECKNRFITFLVFINQFMGRCGSSSSPGEAKNKSEFQRS